MWLDLWKITISMHWIYYCCKFQVDISYKNLMFFRTSNKTNLQTHSFILSIIRGQIIMYSFIFSFILGWLILWAKLNFHGKESHHLNPLNHYQSHVGHLVIRVSSSFSITSSSVMVILPCSLLSSMITAWRSCQITSVRPFIYFKFSVTFSTCPWSSCHPNLPHIWRNPSSSSSWSGNLSWSYLRSSFYGSSPLLGTHPWFSLRSPFSSSPPPSSPSSLDTSAADSAGRSSPDSSHNHQKQEQK